MADVSPQSIVEDGAKLGDGVRIGPYCYIGPDVTIGRNCTIENNVTIVGHTKLGEDCHAFPLAVIGVSRDGDDSKSHCTLGNANHVREHTTVYGGTKRRPTTLGQDNLLMIASQVGPGATVGDHGIFANCTHIGPKAVIKDYVRCSAFSLIGEGTTVGAYTFTAGYALVDRDAPPFAMVQGSPYRVRGVNTHNLKACGFGEDDIRSLKTAFRELFNGQGQKCNPDVLARLAADKSANPYVKTLVQELGG
jgi:UDP-N-acetylglucosamine acyltransferase